MKHVIYWSQWEYSETPFPAFRVELVFGRNKRDFEFLPTKIAPRTVYRVYNLSEPAGDFGTEEEAKAFIRERGIGLSADIKKLHILDENTFRIIKTKEKGTILVVPGEDKTNRALLFTGENGGFRGDVSIHESTTANLIKTAKAANNCDSRVEVAAVMEPGQRVVIHSWGRRHNVIVTYEWDGEAVSRKVYQKEEWDTLQEPTDGEAI